MSMLKNIFIILNDLEDLKEHTAIISLLTIIKKFWKIDPEIDLIDNVKYNEYSIGKLKKKIIEINNLKDVKITEETYKEFYTYFKFFNLYVFNVMENKTCFDFYPDEFFKYLNQDLIKFVKYLNINDKEHIIGHQNKDYNSHKIINKLVKMLIEYYQSETMTTEELIDNIKVEFGNNKYIYILYLFCYQTSRFDSINYLGIYDFVNYLLIHELGLTYEMLTVKERFGLINNGSCEMYKLIKKNPDNNYINSIRTLFTLRNSTDSSRSLVDVIQKYINLIDTQNNILDDITNNTYILPPLVNFLILTHDLRRFRILLLSNPGFIKKFDDNYYHEKVLLLTPEFYKEAQNVLREEVSPMVSVSFDDDIINYHKYYLDSIDCTTYTDVYFDAYNTLFNINSTILPFYVSIRNYIRIFTCRDNSPPNTLYNQFCNKLYNVNGFLDDKIEFVEEGEIDKDIVNLILISVAFSVNKFYKNYCKLQDILLNNNINPHIIDYSSTYGPETYINTNAPTRYRMNMIKKLNIREKKTDTLVSDETNYYKYSLMSYINKLNKIKKEYPNANIETLLKYIIFYKSYNYDTTINKNITVILAAEKVYNKKDDKYKCEHKYYEQLYNETVEYVKTHDIKLKPIDETKLKTKLICEKDRFKKMREKANDIIIKIKYGEITN